MAAKRLSNKHFWALLLLGIVLISASVTVAESQHQAAVSEAKQSALQNLSTRRAKIEGIINAALVVVQALQAEISLTPELSQRRFARLAKELIKPNLPIRHIALAPDLVVQYIFPLTGNEDALGFDYRTSASQFATVSRAIAIKDIVMAGPLDLVQGGRALIVRAPIFSPDEKLWGVIAEVIDINRLLELADINDVHQWSIRGTDGEGLIGKVFYGNADIWSKDSVRVDVTVPGGSWVLAHAPEGSQQWAKRGVSYWAIISAGLFLTTIILSILFSLFRAHQKIRDALQTISYQAHYDSITGLPNRQRFVDTLHRLIARADVHTDQFVVMFIDLDHFKDVNDSLGHHIGDQLIQSVAERLSRLIRADDIVARLGGDEFVIVCREVDNVGAQRRAEHVLQALQNPFSFHQQQVYVSASIGIADFPRDGSTVDELLKHADLAMYSAKSAGRGTFSFFNQQLREDAERHIQLHSEMKLGLDLQQFHLVYQPIIHPKTGTVSKCEALLRWQHPERGLISPATFIPVAERTGLINRIGDWVLEQVCEDLTTLADDRLVISINRSEREFTHQKDGNHWLSILSRHSIAPKRIVFEITESLFMTDKDKQKSLILSMREAGIRFAIDDFGTGYSSLNYLQHYPVDFLKVDRSFLEQIPENTQQTALIDAMLRVAHALGIETVAEGVERKEQYQRLVELGADYVQGFYLAKPMRLAALTEFLRSHRE